MTPAAAARAKKRLVRIERHGGGNEKLPPETAHRVEKPFGVFANRLLREKQRIVGEINVLVAHVFYFGDRHLHRFEAHTAAHVGRYYAHRAAVGAAARELYQILVPVVALFVVKNVAARRGHFGHVHRLGGFINALQRSSPEIPEKLRPCVLPLPDAHRVRNFQAFVSHKAREHSAHHDGFARRAALARYLQCPRALRGEAVYRVQVRAVGKVDFLAGVVVHKGDLDVGRREARENRYAQGRRAREFSDGKKFALGLHLRDRLQKFLKARIYESDFHFSGPISDADRRKIIFARPADILRVWGTGNGFSFL